MEPFAAVFGPGPGAFESAIFEYVMSGGEFLALTMDSGFVDIVKQTLHQSLGLSKKCFTQVSTFDDLLALLGREPKGRFLVCMERVIPGVSPAQAIEKILGLNPETGIIVVTHEVDQYTLALLVEQGAHNVITKPISIPSFTEKLAFTIAPQGRLSKLIDKGKRLVASSDWGAALAVAEEILAQKPDSAVGFMLKGDAYKGLKMMPKAEDMYKRAARSAELYLTPLKRLAELYEQAGDRDRQLDYLYKLHEISPLNTQRVLRIGELEIAMGNVPDAADMFERAMSVARKEAAEMMSNLSARIADICVERDPDMAAKYSKKSLDLRGEAFSLADIATVNILGISLRKQGKWEEAIREYRRVLAVIPDHAGLLYNMALAYSDGGRADMALELVRRALELDPRLPDSGKNIAFNIGRIFQKGGHDGSPFFKKAYEQDPNDTMVWKALKRAQAERAELATSASQIPAER